MGKILLTFLLTAAITGSAQATYSSAPGPGPAHANIRPTRSPNPEAAIRRLMTDQTAAWNRGSIDEFMKGYWESDSLVFIGKAGPTYGYAAALARYKASYDSPDKMGQLTFSEIRITRLSPEYCFVIGKWALKRKAGDVGGTYTLLFRRIGGQWFIVVDHTS